MKSEITVAAIASATGDIFNYRGLSRTVNTINLNNLSKTKKNPDNRITCLFHLFSDLYPVVQNDVKIVQNMYIFCTIYTFIVMHFTPHYYLTF